LITSIASTISLVLHGAALSCPYHDNITTISATMATFAAALTIGHNWLPLLPWHFIIL
jgi:hypothetical protein